MSKICHRTLFAGHDENHVLHTAGSKCIEGECMAWAPEVSIEVPDALGQIGDIAKQMSASLGAIGVSVNGNKITIAAHCVLLEPKR